jgi:hypothetical protein
MTSEISNLRGQVLAAKSHLSAIEKGIPRYNKDEEIPDELFIRHALFRFDGEGADLLDGEPLEDKYYLYQFIPRIFVLTFSLASRVTKFFEDYKGDLEKSPAEAAKLENAKVYIRREIQQAEAEYGKLKSDGLYLVRYSAPGRELYDDKSTPQ